MYFAVYFNNIYFKNIRKQVVLPVFLPVHVWKYRYLIWYYTYSTVLKHTTFANKFKPTGIGARARYTKVELSCYSLYESYGPTLKKVERMRERGEWERERVTYAKNKYLKIVLSTVTICF